MFYAKKPFILCTVLTLMIISGLSSVNGNYPRKSRSLPNYNRKEVHRYDALAIRRPGYDTHCNILKATIDVVDVSSSRIPDLHCRITNPSPRGNALAIR